MYVGATKILLNLVENGWGDSALNSLVGLSWSQKFISKCGSTIHDFTVTGFQNAVTAFLARLLGSTHFQSAKARLPSS